MERQHLYALHLQWTGNTGTGTNGYNNYERSHFFSVKGKEMISCSSDVSFRGDKSKYNPEELLVASISSCHMLWFLHLCSDEGIVVTGYSDNATGIMQETVTGSGFFKEVILCPQVTVKHDSMIDKANALHKKANEFCFIANSLKFPVYHQPNCIAENN